MTREERNNKLKHFITCLKCEVTGKECDFDCPIQYEAGNTGEIIENLEAISKALEHEPSVAQERYEDLCEYFGNMKDILNNREDFKAWLGRIKWHLHKAEELYEKYEQEPCEDAISRQAVLDCFTATKLKKFDFVLHAREEIKKLPRVNPHPKTGYWIVHEKPHGIRYLECPHCNVWYLNEHLIRNSYCPNCGVKMVELHESEDRK